MTFNREAPTHSPRISACSSCDAPIIWAISPKGARLPLDARPVTAYHLLQDGVNAPDAVKVTHVYTPTDDVLDGLEGFEVEHVYISHFVTCPNAAQHKKAKP